MLSEAAKAKQAMYNAKMSRYFSLKLNRKTDSKLIERLEEQKSIQAYIKRLIREDIEKTAQE